MGEAFFGAWLTRLCAGEPGEGLREALRAEQREPAGALEAGLRALARWCERLGLDPLSLYIDDLPDPSSALLSVDALEVGLGALPAGQEPEALSRLLRLGSQSLYLGRLAAREAEVMAALVGSLDEAREAEAQVARASALCPPKSGPEGLARLRRWRMAELTRAFAREAWGLAPVEVTTAEVSALAAACLEAVLNLTRAELALVHGEVVDERWREIPFVVIGMGKLGGWELNFSSDVDLVYLYGTDAGFRLGRGGDEPGAVHRFFVQVARKLTALMEEPAPEGMLWRVDLRLRPGGSRGPLVHSLDAAEAFYEAWGGTFERVAWLKARPVAGDKALGERFLARMRPFVYRKALGLGALEDLRGLKDKIDRYAAETLSSGQRLVQEQDAGFLGWDAKVGRGGIREVEFTVQALQLVYGGRRPELQGPSTLPALARLRAAGLLPGRDVELLEEAYVWLRRLEHRVQMEGERQTHALPTQRGEFARLGRRMGFADGAPSFEARLAEVQGQVHAIFDRLLGGHKDHEQRLPAPIQALLDAPELLPEDERQQAWALEAGFARPRQSLGHLLVLRERAGSPFAPGAPARLAQLGALCLRDSAQSADPDLALVHLTSLMLTGGALWGFVEALLGSAPMRAALMNLLGASRHLAQMLIRQPEWVGALVEDQGWMTPGAIASGDPQRCGREALDAELARYMEPVQGQEARLAALRRFQQRRELRVGLADLAGLLEVEQVGRALSDLAEAVLEEVCREAWREVAPRLAGAQGSSEGAGPPGFCVLALGRLGSRELTYGSDLDLLFFYEEGPEAWRASSGEALAAYGKLARRVVAFLTAQLGQGPLYNIDARLRPNGRQGALVVSLAGWLDYHERQGQLWERQSLLRARAVAGDRGFGAGVEAQVRALCFGERTEEEARALCAELAAMRIRMREAAQPPPPKPPAVVRTRPQGYNLKLGTDGIADAEFAVQALQMVFGARHEALRTTSVSEALRAARALGLMPAALLEGAAQGRRLLCLLESRLRILEGQGEDALPLDDPEAMLRLARRVGYRGEDPAELLRRELARARAQVGALREAVLERAEFLDRAQGEGSGDADLGGGR